jgi:hypothetical protein
MTLPIDNQSLLGDFLPNIMVKRVILSYGSSTTQIRGDNPHYTIPTKEEFLKNLNSKNFQSQDPNLDVNPNPLDGDGPVGQGLLKDPLAEYAKMFGSLVGTDKRKTSLSGYQANQADIKNEPLKIRIDFFAREVIENKFLTRFINNEKIKKFLKVRIFLSTDPAFDTFVSLANQSRNTLGFKLLFAEAADTETWRTISFNDALDEAGKGWTEDMDQFNSYTNEQGQEVYDIMFSETFTVNVENPQHVSFFIYPFIDQEEFEKSFSPAIDLNGIDGILGMLVGKQTVEPVIINGEPSNSATYYVDSNNVIWTGQVNHQYEAFLKEGGTSSFLTAAEAIEAGLNVDLLRKITFKGANKLASNAFQNAELTQVSVPNIKLQDFRTRKQIENLVIDFSEAKDLIGIKPISPADFSLKKIKDSDSFFGPPMITKDMGGSVRLLFSADIKKMLIQNSNYGKIWDNMTDTEKKGILDGKIFQKLTLVRRRIEGNSQVFGNYLTPGKENTDLFDEETAEHIVGEYSIAAAFGLADNNSQDNSAGFIQKVGIDVLDPQRKNVFFTAYDDEISRKTSGYYQYGLKYSFPDELLALLEDRTRLLQVSHQNVSYLCYLAELPKYYDLITDSYTPLFGEEQTERYNKTLPLALARFEDLHRLISGPKNLKPIIQSLLNITHPKTGTPDGLVFLKEMIDILLQKAFHVIGQKPVEKSPSYSPAPKASNKNNLIQGEHYFDMAVEYGQKLNMGYDYLQHGSQFSVANKGLLGISYDYFDDRAAKETKKYFNDPNKSVYLKLEKDLNPGNATSLNDAKYTYLSPSLINSGGRSRKLINDETVFVNLNTENMNIQYSDLNKVMTEIIRNKTNTFAAPIQVSQKEYTNLSMGDKKMKYQLREILASKGGSYEEGVTGATAFGIVQNFLQDFTLTETQQNLPWEDVGGIEIAPPQELLDEKQFREEIGDEKNFNDSMLFLTRTDQDVSIDYYSKFLSRLKQAINPEAIGLGISVLTNEDVKKFPNQYKQLITFWNGSWADKNPTNILGFPAGTPQLDFLNTLDKSFGIWMNYFNLVRVEYLVGYDTSSLSSPIWAPITNEKFNSFKNSNKVILCRLKQYANKSAGVSVESFFSLPIYNHYFILAPNDWLQNNTSPFVENGLQESLKKMMQMQKQMNTLNNIPVEALAAAGPGGAGPPLTTEQQDISLGQGAAGNLGGPAFTFGGNQGGANDPGPGGGGFGGGGVGGFGGGGGY